MYIGDYMADTMHLSTLEHGAFFLILSAYYKNKGPLPDNDSKLACIARMTLSDWSAIRSTIAGFFEIANGLWTQKRAEAEIRKAFLTQDARRRGAMVTNAKLGRTHSDTLTVSLNERSPCRSEVGNPQSQSQPQSYSESEAKSEPKKGKGTRVEIIAYCAEIQVPESDAIWFFDKNEGCGWKNNGKAIADWKSTIRSWKANDYLPSFKKAVQSFFVTPAQRKAALEGLIENHPCNSNSKKHNGDETPDQLADYRKLKADLETTNRIIANGGSK